MTTNVKFSQLPESTPLTGSEIIPLTQTGDSVSTTIGDIQEFVSLGYTPINVTAIGVPNGVASLDVTGKVPAAQLPIVSGSLGNPINLNGSSTSSTTTNPITIDSVLVSDGTTTMTLTGINSMLNISTTGLNGMDSGTPSNDSVAVYVIYNRITDVSGLLGTVVTSTAPLLYGGSGMPSGFTMSSLISVISVDSSGNIIPFTQKDNTIYALPLATNIQAYSNLLHIITATNITAVNLAGGTAGSLPYQTGAGTTGMLPVGTNGQVLTLVSGLPVWSPPAVTGMISPMTTSGDLIYGGVAGAPVRLPIGTNGYILSVSAGTPTWIPSTNIYSPTAVAITGGTIDGVVIGTSVQAAAKFTTVNATTFIGSLTGHASLDLAISGGSLTGPLLLAADPTSSLQAATKNYVDSAVVGLSWKTPAACATTANITLSGEQTIDGIVTSASRVFVNHQTATTDNGIYVSGSGAWSRSSDAATGSQIVGAAIFISAGAANGGTSWTNTNIGTVTIGTTPITFVQFAGSVTYSAGTGLSLTGTVFANSGVLSITGTTNQISASSSTGSITLSLPQNINSGASPTFVGSNFSAIPYSAMTGTVPTWNQNTTGNAVTSNTSTNIAGGTAGSLPYQTGAGVTAMLAAGTNGYTLTMVSGSPAWTSMSNYAVLNANNTFSSAGTPVTINSTNSDDIKLCFEEAGVIRGYIGADLTHSFYTINAGNTSETFTVDQTGNGTFLGQVSATQFNGSGAGLTGTATSLTVGTASTANALNVANSYQGYQFVATQLSGIANVNGSGSTWYKVMLSSDTTNGYLLSSNINTTQSAAISTGNNTLRPFTWNLSSGAVEIDGTGVGTTFGGTVTVDSSTTNAILVQGSLAGGSGEVGIAITNSNATGISQLSFTTGGTNGNKYIRADGSNGNLEFLNSAYSSIIATLTNTGGLTLGSGVTGTIIQANTSGSSGSIYSTAVAPSSSNYALAWTATGTYVNAVSAINVNISGSNIIAVSSTGASVTGTLGISGALTAPVIDVNDSTVNAQAIVLKYSTSSTGGYIGANSTKSLSVTNGAGSLYTMTLDQSGNVSFPGSVTMASYTVTSDIRLKTDIIALTNYSDIIDATNVYEYTKDGRRQFGMIAQEAQEIVPIMVRETIDGMLGIEMNGYIPLLIAEVKELRARIALLENNK